MTRSEVVQVILKECQGQHLSESLRFGGYVTQRHPVIGAVYQATSDVLLPKDIAKRSVGKIADMVIDKMPSAQQTNEKKLKR